MYITKSCNITTNYDMCCGFVLIGILLSAKCIKLYYVFRSRSQWSSGLRHELFSPASTLRSWVRVPLRHGCLCVFCVRFFCLYIVSSETASGPNKRLMRTYHWISLFMSYIFFLNSFISNQNYSDSVS
jgi:hypothetical protein